MQETKSGKNLVQVTEFRSACPNQSSPPAVERSGRTFLNPARVYGARDADGSLLHSEAKPNAPETVPTFKFVPISDLLETLRSRPASCSVLEYNGSNHFNVLVPEAKVNH